MVRNPSIKEKDKREREKEIPVTKSSVRWDVKTIDSDGTAAIDTR